MGRAVEEYGRRDQLAISTKVALEWQNGKVFRNSAPERIEKEIDDSLKRLRTDHIDIYYIHWPDPLVPFERTAETMKALFDSGKIRAIGVSNYSPEKAAPLHICQPPYNLFERGIEENGIKDFCAKK